jgi:energy-coupling factor transport system permease protein
VLGSTPRFLSYQAGESVLHRLDARTKLIGTAAIVAGALAASVPQGMIVMYALGAVIGATAMHLLPSLWRTLRPLLVLIVLFGILITVITPGKPLGHFWILVPSHEGLDLAIRLGLQSLLIIYTTSLLTLTTPPLAVANGLEWTLGFLEKIRFPIRDVISMVAIGLTFVPLLIEETRKVILAQRARGADLGMNALMDENAMAALLIPLLLANLRRGEELAESMEARLYGSGERTSMRERRFDRIDGIAAAILVCFIAITLLVSFAF